MAARHKEGYNTKQSMHHTFSCVQRAYRSMTSGEGVDGHRVPVDTTGIIEAGLETGDFVEE